MPKCSDAEMLKCSNTQNAQVLKCSNTQKHKCTKVQMLKCSKVQKQMHKWTNAQRHKMHKLRLPSCNGHVVQMPLRGSSRSHLPSRRRSCRRAAFRTNCTRVLHSRWRHVVQCQSGSPCVGKWCWCPRSNQSDPHHPPVAGQRQLRVT